MAKGETIKTAYSIGSKVRNRHLGEHGLIEAISVNAAGNWYHMVTVTQGMSLGIWHETDIDGAPKAAAPTEKAAR